MYNRNIDSVSKRTRKKKETSFLKIKANRYRSYISSLFPQKPTLQKLTSFYLISMVLFQSLAGVFMYMPTQRAYAANSWYSDYAYRIKIPVSSSTAQTDYQMSITLHTKTGTNTAGEIYLNSHLQDTTNFNDIRFTDTTNNQKSFWIEKIEDETGGKKATVWVKLNTPATGTTDYYLYYGKASDTNSSNYDNTFTKDYNESGLVGLWHMDETPGSELLTDGNLETWTNSTTLANWTNDNVSTGVRDITEETTNKQSGSYALKLTATNNTTAANFGVYQNIATVSNQTYQVNLYQYLASRTAGTLKIEAWDNTNSVSLGSQSVTTVSSAYSYLSFRFTSTNTTSVRIKIYLNGETTSGVVYIDTISVKPSTNTLTDSSGNNNTGTIYGASRTDTDGGQWGSRSDVKFSTGSSLQFDGVDDYVDGGNGASLNVTTAVTLEAWMYRTGNNNGDGIAVIAGKGLEVSNYPGYRLLYNSSIDKLAFSFWNGTAAVSLYTPTANIALNKWYHIVATFDGSIKKYYINGSLFYAQNVGTNTIVNGTDTFKIGRNAGNNQYLKSSIDEVRLYNRVLSAEEIYRQYNYSKYVSPAPTWNIPNAEEQYALGVSSRDPSFASLTSATLNGDLTGLGGESSASVSFKYGLSADSLNQATATQTMNNHGSFAQTLTGLAADTTYYFQAVATNSTNTVLGEVKSFRLYTNRVKIPVSSSTAQTDYQMSITLHSKSGTNTAGDIYLNSHLQDTTTFNDIRFTDATNNQKSFWIEKIEDETGGRKATVWVKLNTPATGTTDYYLYYGKPSDTNSSNYDNTFTKDYNESGLVGLWHMDEGSGGATADSSGNNNAGTLKPTYPSNNPAWQSSDSKFSTGSALQFDGVDDYADAGNGASLNVTTAVTLGAWIYKTGSNSSNNVEVIAGKGLEVSNYPGYRLLYNSLTDALAFSFWNGTAGVSLYTPKANIALNKWYHIVATFDGSIKKYYINGSLFYAQNVGANTIVNGMDTFKIGRNTSSTQYFKGSIDEVCLYDRVLSADEVYRQYNYSKYVSPAPVWSVPGTEEQYALGILSKDVSLASLTSATLNGDLTGLGGESSASVSFKYGLSADNLDQTIITTQIMNNHGSFAQTLTGLAADTLYYFQAVATNSTGTVLGEVKSFRTASLNLESDYYHAIINPNGTLTFTNKNTNAIILDGAPKFNLNYGASDYVNGNSVVYDLIKNGTSSIFTGIDDNNPYAKVTHRYELNANSPTVKYTSTIEYKQNVDVMEERFDFTVPTQDAQIMTRDLKLKTFDASQTYWSDLYTPKVVKFSNGLSFSGNDTIDAMRLQTYKADSILSFYADYKDNHPHSYNVKNGGGAEADMSKTRRLAGNAHSASITFTFNTSSVPKSLVKTRQPYGYDAILNFTNHADSEPIAMVNAVAYGSEDNTASDYGSKGIMGRGLGWTKSVFVSGANTPYADLDDADFKSLTDKIYKDGAEIVGHSITGSTDSRETVANGLQVLSQYNAKNWIDHGASGGSGNWEDLASQGALEGNVNYILDIFDRYNYQYAWSYKDLTAADYQGLNMLGAANTGANTPFLFYNNYIDDNINDNKKIYLWSTLSTEHAPDLFYTNAHVDSLIAERGVHVGHEYMASSYAQNHAYYTNPTTNKVEITPTFDSELAYIAQKKEENLIWSPTVSKMGDYLVPLKDIAVTNNDNGSYTITNNSTSSLTGITLLSENDLKSVTIDNKQLTSFGDSFGSKELVLPTLNPQESFTLYLSYGTKDTSIPTITSNDTDKKKVNEITGIYDTTIKTLTMTAEGNKETRSFTVKIPALAGKTLRVQDADAVIGDYLSSSTGEITFSAPLGSIHTFLIAEVSSTAFISPTKPQTNNIGININSAGSFSLTNLPPTITQIAISPDNNFTNISWEDITKKEELLKQYATEQTIYIKFRTNDGAVSDTITYNNPNNTDNPPTTDTTTPLQDGDIVKTPDNPDIYVIKTINNKTYKRLILSPNIFNSYQHLNWNNVKTISQDTLNQYQTSTLVKEVTDNIIYSLTDNGDQGKRQPWNITQTYDPDSIYTINKTERDSYEWEE